MRMVDAHTRARVWIAVLLMVPVMGWANPVSVNGQSLIAFAMVAFWALVIESGIVTLALVSCGALERPSDGPVGRVEAAVLQSYRVIIINLPMQSTLVSFEHRDCRSKVP